MKKHERSATPSSKSPSPSSPSTPKPQPESVGDVVVRVGTDIVTINVPDYVTNASDNVLFGKIVALYSRALAAARNHERALVLSKAKAVASLIAKDDKVSAWKARTLLEANEAFDAQKHAKNQATHARDVLFILLDAMCVARGGRSRAVLEEGESEEER